MVEFVEGERGDGGSNDYRPAEDTMTVDLQRMIDRSEGRQLLQGWVPFTTYWLLDEGGAVVAVSRLGHALNDGLSITAGTSALREALGAPQGLRQVGACVDAGRRASARHRAFPLMVDSDNAGSIRVIEANGGVLEDERIDPERGMFRRYWIG